MKFILTYRYGHSPVWLAWYRNQTEVVKLLLTYANISENKEELHRDMTVIFKQRNKTVHLTISRFIFLFCILWFIGRLRWHWVQLTTVFTSSTSPPPHAKMSFLCQLYFLLFLLLKKNKVYWKSKPYYMFDFFLSFIVLLWELWKKAF